MTRQAIALSTLLGFRTLLRGPGVYLIFACAAVLLAASAGVSFRPRSGTGNFAEVCASAMTLATSFSYLVDRRFLVSPDAHLGVVARKAQRGCSWGVDLASIAALALASAAGMFVAGSIGLMLRQGPVGDLVIAGVPALVLGSLAGLSVALWVAVLAEVFPRLLVQVSSVAVLFFTLSPGLLPSRARVLVFPVSPRHLSSEEWSGVLPAPHWFLAGILHVVALALIWWAIAMKRRHSGGARRSSHAAGDSE